MHRLLACVWSYFCRKKPCSTWNLQLRLTRCTAGHSSCIAGFLGQLCTGFNSVFDLFLLFWTPPDCSKVNIPDPDGKEEDARMSLSFGCRIHPNSHGLQPTHDGLSLHIERNIYI